MKLLTLNVWGATRGQVLFDYIREEAEDTDIFCFQEIFSALPGAPEISSGGRMFLFQELSRMLPEFAGFYDPRSSEADFNGPIAQPISHGTAMFVRKNLEILNYSAEIIEQTHNANDAAEGWTKAQVLKLEHLGGAFFVINFHGVAQPGNKLDTPQRLAHAKRLRLIWDSLDGGKILCGDFNMYPEIESIKLLEERSRNLIKEFNVQNTRNNLSWAKYPGGRQTFADFTFVSSEIKVKNFEVPYNEVSDHLPMILEFDFH
ncbi:MAG: endonuclease/exonuclease/phosphatase family protein [Candidatus Doudnabacteria bacterium]|nr:endonuclease/exonuclease/phosphatase family protein [Candidatus Doudnabacteria bacterium]